MSAHASSTPAAEWPGRQRRSPRLGDPSYLVHRPLSRALGALVERELASSGGRLGTVVDVGCGARPYYPWFADRCERYVGVDLGPEADVQAASDRVPLESGCADLVLSTQVLEHVDDPAGTVAEIGRLLKPGGVALVSTHGVRPYHPTPNDYWRWTGTGLEKLFADDGSFSSIEVVPCGGTLACLAFLVALYASLAGRRLRKRAGAVGIAADGVLRIVVRVVNAVGLVADARFARQRDFRTDNTMSANYLVVARR